ncbi:MAG: serine hydrolase domain-containing protein [Candidatus Hinthialibacter antarcticus]|nr:serine hydrolase domain-containing protein [Candidatus Hinthialibacter antarcticus]
MKRLLFSCLAIVFAAVAVNADSFKLTKPEKVGISSERLEKLDAVMQGFVDRGELAGMVSLVARKGKIAHFKAYGFQNIEDKTPMNEDSLFRIYSMTKPITCAALMMLVEDGKLFLTDPVSKYLPEFKDMQVLIGELDGEVKTEPAKSEITLQRLAMHTSGIGYGIPENKSPTLSKKHAEIDMFNPANPIKDAISALAEFPLLHQPGTTWEYGASIDVLARVIEVVAGQPFGEFLQERMFDPLKMEDAGFSTPKEDWGRVATVYTIKEGKIQPAPDSGLPLEKYYKIGVQHAGGHGLMTSAMDYARFAQMLLDGGELEGERVLGPKSIERMSTNLIRDEANNTSWHNDQESGFGLGVSVKKDQAYSSTLSSLGTYGWSGYASTLFFVDPEEDLIAVFMSQHVPTNPKQSWQTYTNLVYQAIVE